MFLAIVSKLGRFGSQRRHADRQTPTTDERDRDDIRANGRPVERLPERHPLVHSSGSGCSEVPSESTISPVAPRAKNAVFMANYTTIFVNQFVSCVCVCVWLLQLLRCCYRIMSPLKRSDLDEAVPCEICATMVTRRNLNRHLRDRHGDASAHRQTSVTSRSSSLDASTVAATTSMAPCSTNDMMKAAVDALDQHHSFSEMHLTEYIRQCYPEVSESDRRGLMIGAVAGAQHASRLHFVVQTNQSSEDPAKRQMAAKAASGMSFWNMGLREPPRVAQPVRISEAAPTADNEVQQTSTMWAPVTPVSYTHLTLPTIYSV